MKRLLLTGGMGYIGSHTSVYLLEQNYEVVIYDNLLNSNEETLKVIQNICPNKKVHFVNGDIDDKKKLEETLRNFKIEAVIHFAGLKSVKESSEIPLEYYQVNISGTITLLSAMQSCNIKTIIFSSSATVYGSPEYLPIDEKHKTGAINPYGRCKLYIEEILQDLSNADSEWKVCVLRYFNPAGSHPSGMLGEDPKQPPANLMPIIAQVANQERSKLEIFGCNFNTNDGTGIRDYIHVVDLAMGHIAAIENIKKLSNYEIINLGTGEGYSVLQMIQAYEQVSDKKINFSFSDRRLGDTGACFADATKARQILNWQCQYGLLDMCKHSWNYKQNKTNG